MKQASLTIPEIGLIAATRAAGGAGIALLLGGLLKPEQCRKVGRTLLAIGIITTFPLLAEVLGKLRAPSNEGDG